MSRFCSACFYCFLWSPSTSSHPLATLQRLPDNSAILVRVSVAFEVKYQNEAPLPPVSEWPPPTCRPRSDAASGRPCDELRTTDTCQPSFDGS